MKPKPSNRVLLVTNDPVTKGLADLISRNGYKLEITGTILQATKMLKGKFLAAIIDVGVPYSRNGRKTPDDRLPAVYLADQIDKKTQLFFVVNQGQSYDQNLFEGYDAFFHHGRVRAFALLGQLTQIYSNQLDWKTTATQTCQLKMTITTMKEQPHLCSTECRFYSTVFSTQGNDYGSKSCCSLFSKRVPPSETRNFEGLKLLGIAEMGKHSSPCRCKECIETFRGKNK
jgi:hypothetical protein